MRPVGLNLMRPVGNPSSYPAPANQINTMLNQGQGQGQLRGGRFNSMLSNIVNSKPGCSSCGK